MTRKLALDRILRTGVEIIEGKGKQRYALIPVMNDCTKDKITDKDPDIPVTSKNTKKKKKNKIACSYCHEIGHTRAKCEKRLLNPMN